MEAEAIDTLVAQNKALINLLNNKLGNVSLAAANTQIGPCDCVEFKAILVKHVQQFWSNKHLNKLITWAMLQDSPTLILIQKHINLVGGIIRILDGEDKQPNPSLVQPNTSKQPSELELALQKLTLSTTTFIDGTNNFMNETKATLKNQKASIRNLEVQVGQIAKQLTERSPNTFPSNAITNPKEECKVIQLRSGKKVEKKTEEAAEDSSQMQQEKEDATPPKVAEPKAQKPAEKEVPKQNSAAEGRKER
ncbi:hypothetical protein PIB30_093141 [Stylosanthes scabra]|uniref:Uncharacterized protein n=1 Tax=Stylosanthes scabra TaxID=79078 RepID=A0ABU6TXY4_9FABA|nr:hypothetical protein [Stylosanthes scabra]